MKHEIIEDWEQHAQPKASIKRTIRDEALHILYERKEKQFSMIANFNAQVVKRMMDDYEPTESQIIKEMEIVKAKYFPSTKKD